MCSRGVLLLVVELITNVISSNVWYRKHRLTSTGLRVFAILIIRSCVKSSRVSTFANVVSSSNSLS